MRSIDRRGVGTWLQRQKGYPSFSRHNYATKSKLDNLRK